MSFNSLTDGSAPSNALNTTRLKRQLAEQAITAATAADWEEAARTNERLLELGPDSEAENRLAKAYWELGELANAREHYHSIDGHDVVALAPLPVPAYDFEATLAMARARFPREVALEPEVRLRRLEDAHARELADRSTRNAKLLDAPFDAVADRMHQLHVDELKRLMLAPRG